MVPTIEDQLLMY